MVIPGDHWDMPPKSEWLNWAMVPPPERSARKMVRTASGETEWRRATRVINPSSFNGMIVVLTVTARFVLGQCRWLRWMGRLNGGRSPTDFELLGLKEPPSQTVFPAHLEADRATGEVLHLPSNRSNSLTVPLIF